MWLFKRGGIVMKWLKLALKVVIFTLTLIVNEVLVDKKPKEVAAC